MGGHSIALTLEAASKKVQVSILSCNHAVMHDARITPTRVNKRYRRYGWSQPVRLHPRNCRTTADGQWVHTVLTHVA